MSFPKEKPTCETFRNRLQIVIRRPRLPATKACKQLLIRKIGFFSVISKLTNFPSNYNVTTR
jgi:septum formation topological specificity factor MinE